MLKKITSFFVILVTFFTTFLYANINNTCSAADRLVVVHYVNIANGQTIYVNDDGKLVIESKDTVKKDAAKDATTVVLAAEEKDVSQVIENVVVEPVKVEQSIVSNKYSLNKDNLMVENKATADSKYGKIREEARLELESMLCADGDAYKKTVEFLLDSNNAANYTHLEKINRIIGYNRAINNVNMPEDLKCNLTDIITSLN